MFTIGLPDPTRDLAHRPGPILDVHNEHVTLAAHLDPRLAQGGARGGRVLCRDPTLYACPRDGCDIGAIERSSRSELPVLSGVEERISRPTDSASRPKSSSDR
jgi:hypothetical protein